MRRVRVINTAIFLAVLGAALPMAGALYFAWSLAFDEQGDVLYEYTTRMLDRTESALSEARKAFTVIEKNKNTTSTCSPEHIKWMHTLSTATAEGKTISYFEQGTERCTSCGLPDAKKVQTKTNFTFPDGLKIGKTQSSVATFIVTRKQDNYDILIPAQRLTDIIVPSDIWLALIYNGNVLSEQNAIDPSLLNIILDKIAKDNSKINSLQATTSLKKEQLFMADGRMVIITQFGPFYYVSSEPASRVRDNYKKLQYLLLPFGLITALFIIGLVIYYSQRRLSLKADLQEALDNQEFLLHYQPIINTQLGTCYGAEALIRWQRADGQMVRPDLFIPYAEEAGIISAITQRVIELVFEQMEAFLTEHRMAHISINVSNEDLRNGWVLELLESKISHSTINRNQIWIELTERTFLIMDEVQQIIIKARNLGYAIVIDDFGTGYSNLSYLQHLPLDVLKIDKSFIDSLGMSSATSNVADHIIEMAKKMNLQLVAEGVEKQDQYDHLKEKKVDYIQGYFFSKPLPANEFIAFFKGDL